MTASRPGLERRILAAIDATPSRIPVMLGDFRTGRTQLLYRLRDRLGKSQCQHIDIERCATTPERFLGAIAGDSPFRLPTRDEPATARLPNSYITVPHGTTGRDTTQGGT